MCSQDSSHSLERLQATGLAELTELFVRLRPHIRAMVEKRLDSRIASRVDASDIVQETFVRATQSLPGYLGNPAVHPVVWLRQIGKHIVAETHRKHYRAKRTPFAEQALASESALLAHQLADSLTSVGERVNRQELRAQVTQLITQMSENDREILEMRHIDGLSNQQASELLGISLEASKKRYHRALVRFRELADAEISDA